MVAEDGPWAADVGWPCGRHAGAVADAAGAVAAAQVAGAAVVVELPVIAAWLEGGHQC